MPDGIWTQALGVITLFWCSAYTPCGCGDVLYLSTLLAKAVYSRLNERGRGRQNNFKPGVPEWDPSCRCRGLQIRSWRLVCIFAMQRAAQSGRREHVFCTPAAKCAARRYQFACLLPSFYVDRNAPFQKPLRTPHPSGLCIPPACSAQAIAVISTNLFALNAGGPSLDLPRADTGVQDRCCLSSHALIRRVGLLESRSGTDWGSTHAQPDRQHLCAYIHGFASTRSWIGRRPKTDAPAQQQITPRSACAARVGTARRALGIARNAVH